MRKAFQYAVDKAAYQVARAGSAQLAGDVATTLITPGLQGREDYDLYPTRPPVTRTRPSNCSPRRGTRTA